MKNLDPVEIADAPRVASTPWQQLSAFTLIELLVVIAIIATLAALAIPTIGAARRASQHKVAVSNMRQIGSAINLYAADKGVLPGPLWPGQMPLLDPKRDGRLVRELAPYLNIPMPSKPTVVNLFVPPAYNSVTGAPALKNARTYVMNMAVPAEEGVINPWGSLADSAAGSPQGLASVSGTAWAFSDADQLHPRVVGTSWQNNTSPKPIHSQGRLAYFFDGHVGDVSDAELAAPNAGP